MSPVHKLDFRKYGLFSLFGLFFLNALIVLISGCAEKSETDKAVVTSSDAGSKSESPSESVAEPQPPEKQTLSEDWYLAESCRECHASQYEDWWGSHHQLAHRRVDLERESEAFSQGTVTDEAGRNYTLTAENGSFGIFENGVELPGIATAVIGETPIQQYVIPFPEGRFQIQGMTWDPGQKEWFNVFGDEERDPGDWGHWSQQGMNWNSNCAWCHMTDFKKNYDFRTGQYSSEWKIEAISCIQCHSGMKQHVEAARNGNYVRLEPANIELAMDNCASCHARREELTANGFHAGEKFDEHFRLVLPDLPHAYFVDGKANEEDYVFASLKLSKMGHKGVSCLDCHNPHSHETILPVEDNSLCLRCHETGINESKVIDPLMHSHHAVDSPGNQCVACHMPKRTYMQRDPRRDHGFTIPDPQLTLDHGVPNACADCHGDQSVEWARDAVERWYPDSIRRAELRTRAKTLQAYYDGNADAWRDVYQLLQKEENLYWRSTYLRILSAMAPGTPESLEAALKGMKADSPVERESALRILANRNDRLSDLQRALYDNSRLVRNQAADTLSTMFSSSQLAFKEWLSYAEANADRPAGALRRAELAIQQGDFATAKLLAEQAASFDQNNPQLLYDVAIMFARTQDVDGALAKIVKAKQLDPSLALLYFGEGLLYAEKGDTLKSIQAMEAAVERDPSQDRWWYNLGVAYMQSGDNEKARQALLKASELNPNDQQYKQLLNGL